MHDNPNFTPNSIADFLHSEPVLTQLVSVVRSDETEYEEGNWRVQQVGSWGKFFLLTGAGFYQAHVWHVVLYDGTRPENVSAMYNTGVGEVEVEGDTITLKSHNSVWKFRILDEEERQQYATARAVFEAEREKKAREAVERLMALCHADKNAFVFVKTPEDIYKLADVIIDNFYPISTTTIELERDYLVSAIAMPFEVHDLFAHPDRKDYCYCGRETHFNGLMKVFDMELEAYDLTVGKCLSEGLAFDEEAKEWVPASDRKAQPNSITVTHWKRTKGYPDAVRDEAFKHVGAVVDNICVNYYEQLLKVLDLI